MGKSHPLALRSRVIAFVEDGHSNRAAARHFRVSPRFVNNLVKLKRATGSLAPRRQGQLGRQAQRPWRLGPRPPGGEWRLDAG